jgi:glucose/arabinose dehydrogenase
MRLSARLALLAASTAALAACTGGGEGVDTANGNAAPGTPAAAGRPFAVEVIASLDEPWAMTFLPGTGQALITEKRGRLVLWSRDGAAAAAVPVAGAPTVDYGGQGGLGDVVAHPDFARNRMVYLSWVEGGDGDTRGAVVGRARLSAPGQPPRLENLEVIWRQAPKVSGRGHFGHRLAFGPDRMLYITNGDRQKFNPAQDPARQSLGRARRRRGPALDDGPQESPRHRLRRRRPALAA